jgi:hypothetical protein
MAIQTKSVYSSHVDTVSHNDETNELTVRWDTGKTSVYSGVPANLAKEVMDAWSVGTALHTQIKGKYDHHYSKGGK